jgi:hypothetical protein
MEFVQAKSVEPSLKPAQAPDLVYPTQAAIACYTLELHATINMHRESVLQSLKLSATIEPLPDMSTHYNKLWGTSIRDSRLCRLRSDAGSLATMCRFWVALKQSPRSPPASAVD